ncbi:MAG: TolC family protein [Pseudomonadota bacterium]
MKRFSISLALAVTTSLSAVSQETIILFEEESEIPTVELTSVEAAPGVCLPIAAAMQAAAQASPDVAVAQAQIAGAKADLRLARSLSRPQVSSFARTQAGDGGLTGNAIDNQVGFRASQRLWDFGDARFAREAANSRVGAAEQTQLSVEADAARRVALSYISALEAFERKQVTSEREDYFRRQLSALQNALEIGGATRSEVAEVAARLAEAEAERFEIDFQIEQSSLQVATDVNRPVSLCYDRSPELPGAADGFSDMETDLALISNPNIEAARRNLGGLKADQARAKRERLPVVDVVAIGSYAYLDQFNTWEFRDRVGIDVSVPIFSGSALNARSQAADAEVARARADLIRQRRQLREDILITRRRALSLYAQSVRRASVEDRKFEQFEAAEIEFDAGLKTLPDLVEDRLDYEQARIELIRVKYALLTERLNLLALTGQLGHEAGPETRGAESNS